MTSTPRSNTEHPRRFIKVEGSINLRDFGGYKTHHGQTVKEGLLFRCGAMSDIPDHAFDDFAELDIGVICDLRSHEEAETSPTPEGGPFACRVHIPIWPGSSTQFQETASKQSRGPSPDQFAEFMASITREIARDHVEAYKKLMRELVSTDKGFLLHCSAGKDRTGFGAAIILTLLGVDHDTVMHDYLVSNESGDLFERMRTRMLQNLKDHGMSSKIDDEIIKVMSGVRAEYLLGAFEEIDTHYGGMSGYLEEVGISAADQKHLTERLLA
jgi:protein-tyrosine phosphatase